MRCTSRCRSEVGLYDLGEGSGVRCACAAKDGGSVCCGSRCVSLRHLSALHASEGAASHTSPTRVSSQRSFETPRIVFPSTTATERKGCKCDVSLSGDLADAITASRAAAESKQELAGV
ncbi:hypothetical protein TcCL_ESM09069 [Trypanosoma cruzi]|nr:hypothetical protein TcCL_ESM09069 [Trypanosoma cruzi]